MALKRKLDKEAFDKLADALKAEYVKKGDEYVLDAEEDPDAAAELKRAKDREAQKAKDEKKRADDLQEKLDEATGNDARKQGDIETLEKSWKDKSEKEKAVLNEKITARETALKQRELDAQATTFAASLTDKVAVIMPHIKGRLSVELNDEGIPVTKVLDAAGKVSAMTLDDLKKDFLANKDFAGILTGSKASGGGASKSSQPTSPSGSANLDVNGKPQLLNRMSSADLVAHIDAKKQG